MGFLKDFGSSNLSCEISVTTVCFDFDGWHVSVTSFETYPKCFLVILAFVENICLVSVSVCVWEFMCLMLSRDSIG